MPLVFLYPLETSEKPEVFLKFPGGIEREK